MNNLAIYLLNQKARQWHRAKQRGNQVQEDRYYKQYQILYNLIKKPEYRQELPSVKA